MQINMLFYVMSLENQELVVKKNIISLLYTSYFKVLSMTDQKPVHFLSGPVSKRLYLVNL